MHCDDPEGPAQPGPERVHVPHVQAAARPPVTGLELAAHQVGQEWRIRLAAAEDLLALVDVELVEMQATVDRM